MTKSLIVLALLLSCGAVCPAPATPPFLRLSEKEKQQAVATARQAVTLWLKKDYERLYLLLSSADRFLADRTLSEKARKERFLKWCQAWRERNPTNAQLRADEQLTHVRVVGVSYRFLTGYVLMNMPERYVRTLQKGTWSPEEKLAFVEYSLRGRRYMQAVLREKDGWKIVGIPLQLDERMVAEYEGRGKTTTP